MTIHSIRIKESKETIDNKIVRTVTAETIIKEEVSSKRSYLKERKHVQVAPNKEGGMNVIHHKYNEKLIVPTAPRGSKAWKEARKLKSE